MSNKTFKATLAAIAVASASLFTPPTHAQATFDPFGDNKPQQAQQQHQPSYQQAPQGYGQQQYATQGQPIQVPNNIVLPAGGIGQISWLAQYDVLMRDLGGQKEVYNLKRGGWEQGMDLENSQSAFGIYRAHRSDYTIEANPTLGGFMKQVGGANQREFQATLMHTRSETLAGIRNYQQSYGQSSLSIADSWPPSEQLTIIPSHAVVNGGPSRSRECYDGRGMPTPCAN